MEHIIPSDFPQDLRVEICSYLDDESLKLIRKTDPSCQQLKEEDIWRRKAEIVLEPLDIKSEEIRRVFNMFKGKVEKKYEKTMKYFEHPKYRYNTWRYNGILQTIEDIEQNNILTLIRCFDPLTLYLYYIKNGEDKLDKLIDKIEFQLDEYEDKYILMFMDNEIKERLKINRNKKFKQFLFNIEKHINDWLPQHIDGAYHDLRRNLLLRLHDSNKYQDSEFRVEGLTKIFLHQPLSKDILQDESYDHLILYEACKNNDLTTLQKMVYDYQDIFEVCKSSWSMADYLCEQEYSKEEIEKIIKNSSISPSLKEKLLSYQKSKLEDKDYQELYEEFVKC